MHRYRSHTCAQLRKTDVGASVRISGWVHRVRDHGGLLFIDLRDHYGLTQIVADPDSPAFKTAETVRGEWVIRVDGEVKARAAETANPNLPTGEIEIFAREIEVLSAAKELPLPVFGEPDYPEDIRLKYRFLDLRRETLHRNIVARTKIIAEMRRRMGEAGFTEYSTPILTASSPEGARDFLVPSRIHEGKFYALPQAPQIYKQLIMVSGFDRYFQIAPCFRDEDPRADRLPGEFYQLDLEMSFVEQEDVFATVEPVIRGVFETFANGKPVTQKLRRIPYEEAMRKYGSDKPDLRNPIEMQDVSAHFRDSGFKVFAGILANDPKAQIWAIPARTGGSRAFCDRMNSWAQSEGQPGLGYVFWRKEGEKIEGAGPVAKNIGEERTEAIRTQLGLSEGDAAFFVAGDPKKFVSFAGAARTRAGEELNLVDRDRFELCWIIDFPFYEWDEESQGDRLRAQPVLDAAGRHGGADHQGPARHQGVPVRHGLQRLRDFVGRHPQPSAGNHGQGVRDSRAFARDGRGAFRRALPCLPVWRAAAWRHGGRHRPHRHAAARSKEPARDHDVPDEPAGDGPFDGRAVGGHAAAAARAASAGGSACKKRLSCCSQAAAEAEEKARHEPGFFIEAG